MTAEVFCTRMASGLYRLCVDGAFYAWHTRQAELADGLTLNHNTNLEVQIQHNSKGKAMLHIVDIPANELVIHQSVNPWEYAYLMGNTWVKDTNHRVN